MGRWKEAKWCLLGSLMCLFVLASLSVFIPGKLTGAVKWVADNTLTSRFRALTEPEAALEPTLVEMVVETMVLSEAAQQPAVVLKEKAGERYLPIWIGLAEATAISVVIEGVGIERPLTADLLCSVITKLGGKVAYIVINDLRNDTFYASVILSDGWSRVEVDSRPSDAIAVALRVRAPIYVEQAVLDEAGIELDQETDELTVMRGKMG